MPNQYLNPDVLFPSLQYGFSQGVIASGTKTLYLAGQTAWDPQQNIIGGRDLGQQTRQALRNVEMAVAPDDNTARKPWSRRHGINSEAGTEHRRSDGTLKRRPLRHPAKFVSCRGDMGFRSLGIHSVALLQQYKAGNHNECDTRNWAE